MGIIGELDAPPIHITPKERATNTHYVRGPEYHAAQ
jgi:hypothetical protein